MRDGCHKAYAVLLGSLHRIHRSGIVGRSLGQVDEAEFRSICEGVVRAMDLSLANLIVREAAGLIDRARGG